jgi:hypothetical protein
MPLRLPLHRIWFPVSHLSLYDAGSAVKVSLFPLKLSTSHQETVLPTTSLDLGNPQQRLLTRCTLPANLLAASLGNSSFQQLKPP